MAIGAVGSAGLRAAKTLRVASVYSGQIVASQAAVAVWLLAWGRGGLAMFAATVLAAAVLVAAWVRLRRRWLFEWLALAISYGVRKRALPATDDPAALLEWVRPGARITVSECDGEPVGVIEEPAGQTALLELGQSASLLVDAPVAMPPLSTLLSPGIRLRLVVTGFPQAFGAGAPATSYRQLTEGRLLAQQRVLLAVQAVRPDGATNAQLDSTLRSALRRIRRRLPSTLGARLLPGPAAYAVLLDLSHHGAQPARETWHTAHAGGLLQATFALRSLPDGAAATLAPRLLALPATASTVALSAGSGPDRLAVRLAAPDPAALTVAAQALRRVLDAHMAHADRCDGAHLPGLAATLPLGEERSGQSGLAVPAAPPPVGGAGLMLGVNRRDEPVIVRLFRAEPARALLVGGPPAAQLVTMRAMALGAEVVVHSGRPQAWEPFVRGVSAPGQTVAVVPPGRPVPGTGTAGTALRPQLVVVDAGPVAGDVGVPLAPWRTVLVVRDEVTTSDLDLLARSDVVVLQPLSSAEAALAAGALGLGEAGDWFTRIRGDMVGVVSRRTVRWALLSATEVEQQLIGTLARTPDSRA